MKKRLSPTIRFLIFVSLIAGLWSLGRSLSVDLGMVREWLAQYPLWISGGLFVLVYVGLTTLLWVGTIDLFRTTGALLFGPYWSTLFVFLAELANASILFVLSRKLGREFIEQKFHLSDPKRKFSPDKAGFWTAFVLRINPLVPFRFMDVGFGLTKIQFSKYFGAVFLGSPLRIFWLQFVIAGMGEAILSDPTSMVEYLRDNPTALKINILYLTMVMAVTLGALIVGGVRRSRGHV